MKINEQERDAITGYEVLMALLRMPAQGRGHSPLSVCCPPDSQGCSYLPTPQNDEVAIARLIRELNDIYQNLMNKINV